jgi:hypothetical protein
MMIEVDTLPRSRLCDLEHCLPLPLGCDEPVMTHVKKSSKRTIYLFFLAETSLKNILAQILSISAQDSQLQESQIAIITVSPVIMELEKQLAAWKDKVPHYLGWSSEPMKGELLPLATRLKMIFWFSRFSLFTSLVLDILDDPDRPLNMTSWSCLQDGLSAGLILVKVFVLEKMQVDAITGKRSAFRHTLYGYSPANA